VNANATIVNAAAARKKEKRKKWKLRKK